MRRTAKLALLTVAMAVFAAGAAQATQTTDPTSLKFPATTVGQQSVLTVTYSIDPAETNRTTNMAIDCTIAQITTCPFFINEANSTCPESANLPAGSYSCTIAVHFFPKLAGGQAQNLIINPTKSVPLSGVGVASSAGAKGKKCKKKKGKGKSAAAAKKKKCGKKKKK